MKTVAIPLPDKDFDVTEVAVPWKLFTRAGHKVVFFTERGAMAAADPLLLTGVLFGQLGAEAEPKAFYEELTRSEEFQKPRSWLAEDFLSADALMLPGGHAPGMKQYLGSADLHARVLAFWKTGKPVGAICHGPLVLARTRDESGRSVLAQVKTTCLPKYMERTAYFISAWKLGRYYRTYPDYVEDEVRTAAGEGNVVRGPYTLSKRGTESDDSPTFVVEDGRYVSARWPGDAYAFSRAMLKRL